MFGAARGIRTHGTVTRTTVFEFYDSHVGLCRSVAKRVLLRAISQPLIPTCCAQCRSVPSSWFAIWFAKLPQLLETAIARDFRGGRSQKQENPHQQCINS